MGIAQVGTLVALAVLASEPAAAPERTFVVDAVTSRLAVSVGKSGLFSFAGHEHEVLATTIRGSIRADPDDVTRSSVMLSFDAASLTVSGQGEPAADVPKVQAKMIGPEVLDVLRFPEIVFRSTLVEGRLGPDGTWNLRVTGELVIHGATRKLTLPLRARVSGSTLTASGQAVIRHSDFGIKPVSVAGVVKVKNELGIDYTIVGKADP